MKISGSISQSLKGLDVCEIPIESFIGLPINDSNENKIGVITSVDTENDLWYGTIDYDILEGINGDKKSFSINI